MDDVGTSVNLSSSGVCTFCSLVADAAENPTFVCDLGSAMAFVNLEQSYPGRSIVVLKGHYDDVLEIPEREFTHFNREMRTLARAIQQAYGCPRMNYAILGNEVAHVHWHLIPRHAHDPNWGRAPWPIKDRKQLSSSGYRQTAQRIRSALGDPHAQAPPASGR